MSLLKTKPNYAPNCIATERGWTNPYTGEILVAIGMLKSKLELEIKMSEKYKTLEQVQKPVVKTRDVPKKVLKKKDQILLGEVVEHSLTDNTVIGENNG